MDCSFRLMSSIFNLSIIILSFFRGFVDCRSFTFTNKCSDTVWPGLLANAGSSPLDTTGFSLASGGTRTFVAPSGWSGRFWARTGCTFDEDTGKGSCSTGDCGSGEIECKGAGAAPPATLIEFTLNGDGGKDYYDVSLVDGYNIPVIVQAADSSCPSTGCLVDLNGRCPTELRVDGGDACKSACEAFAQPEYCCSGEFSNPNTCRPSVYSQVFKTACPRSYSYAYDDATSTFTCTDTDYEITFCPQSTPARPTPSSTQKATKTEPRPSDAMLEDDSWLASLATGDESPATKISVSLVLQFSAAIASIVCLFLH